MSLSLVSCAEGIDWRDIAVTSKTIVYRLLLGRRSYLEELFANEEELEVEREILRQWGKVDGRIGKYGLRWHEHLMCYMLRLIPQTTLTPSLLDMLRTFEDALVYHKEILNLIGSKSSGKSAGMARVALALVTVDPEHSVCRIAAPFKNAADATIWGELTDCFKRMKNRWGEYFPEARIVGTRCIIEGESSRHGFIELIGVDKTGKFQGAKSRDPDRGLFLLMADEVALFPSETFLDILANVTSNPNFFAWTGCNFRRIDTMEGKLCQPEGRRYEDLDMERDWAWESAYNSVTMRIDGHRCPNILSGGRVIYPFLLREEKRASMEKQHGLTGPKYLEQIRSFPNTSMAEFFVLRSDEIASSRANEDGVALDSGTVQIAAGDPSLGGGDACAFGAFEFGLARVPTSDGRYQTLQLFRPIEAIRHLIIDAMMTVTPDWIERVQAVVRNPVTLKMGEKVAPEEQVAVLYAENLARLGIPPIRFGYDASMRGSVVHAILTVLGTRPQTIDFGDVPGERVLIGGNTAREEYTNLRTEMYFGVANLVRSGQFRGSDSVSPAFDQICAHQWEHRGNKQKLESKKDYKDRHEGESPNDADVLAIAVEMAQRNGLKIVGARAPQGGRRGNFNPHDLRGIPAFTPRRVARLQ